MLVCQAHHPHYASTTAAITAAATGIAANLPVFVVSAPNVNLPASKVCYHNADNPMPDNSSLTGQPPMPPLPPLLGFNVEVVDLSAAITTSAIVTTLVATAAIKTAVITTSAITTQPPTSSDDDESVDEDITPGDDSDKDRE